MYSSSLSEIAIEDIAAHNCTRGFVLILLYKLLCNFCSPILSHNIILYRLWILEPGNLFANRNHINSIKVYNKRKTNKMKEILRVYRRGMWSWSISHILGSADTNTDLIDIGLSGDFTFLSYFAKQGPTRDSSSGGFDLTRQKLGDIFLRENMHFKGQRSDKAWCVPRGVSLATTAGELLEGGRGKRSILHLVHPLLNLNHSCTTVWFPEASALTTTLSVQTWYEGWSRSLKDSQSDRDAL